MPPKPLTYTQRDLTTALRGAVAAGLSVKTLEIDRDGKITVQMGVPAEGGSPACQNGENPWDKDLE